MEQNATITLTDDALDADDSTILVALIETNGRAIPVELRAKSGEWGLYMGMAAPLAVFPTITVARTAAIDLTLIVADSLLYPNAL